MIYTKPFLTKEERQKYIDSISTTMRSIAEENDENLQFDYDILRLALYALTQPSVQLPDLRQTVSGERYLCSDGVLNYRDDVIKAIQSTGHDVTD